MNRSNIWISSTLAAGFLAGGGALAFRCYAQGTHAVPKVDPAVTAPAKALGNAFAAVAAHIKPAVVSVYSEKTLHLHNPEFGFPFGDDLFQQFFGQSIPQQKGRDFRIPQRGMGSGMILDAEGHVLTNYHVIRDVDEIKIQLPDKRQFEASVVGTDPKTDVAVIKIKGKVPAGLPTVRLGDSNALKVGDLVIAVGAPFGLTQTVTSGMISAKGRSDVGIADYEDFLQTDAPINPGNSGGPLVNMDGDVVGMNSAIATQVGQSAGVGFSIPSNMLKSLLPTLIKGKRITRGLLGVSIQEITPDLAKQFHLPLGSNGALVAQVNAGSSADHAGIKAGDVITQFAGEAIHSTRDLRNRVAASPPGTTVPLVVLHDGKEQTLKAILGEAEGKYSSSGSLEAPSADMMSGLGLTAKELTAELAHSYGLANQKGVVILGVEEGSPAAEAGLTEGDLVLEVNRQPIRTLDDLTRGIGGGKDGTLLLIKRKNSTLFVVLHPGS